MESFAAQVRAHSSDGGVSAESEQAGYVISSLSVRTMLLTMPRRLDAVSLAEVISSKTFWLVTKVSVPELDRLLERGSETKGRSRPQAVPGDQWTRVLG